MIYLDNAATTKPDKRVVEIITNAIEENYFNPSASYHLGIAIHKEIEKVKKMIVNAVGFDFDNNVIFTGSATEANNLAIMGMMAKTTKQILISQGEHPSVFNVAKQLEMQGREVRFVPLQKNGEVDYNSLEEILKEKETSFISIMAVSNETGAINDLKRIGDLKKKYAPSAIFHSDCVQAFGKIPFNADYMGVDMLTISAHKLYGPKGIGVLCFSPKIRLKPILFGGGQEYGIRSGTDNCAFILAFEEILHFASKQRESFEFVKKLKIEFLSGLQGMDFEINGENCSPYILSLSFNGVRGETLQNMLESKGVIVSRGSACSSRRVGNRTLESMGQKNIIGSLRVSFSKNNSIEEIEQASKILRESYLTLYSTLKG